MRGKPSNWLRVVLAIVRSNKQNTAGGTGVQPPKPASISCTATLPDETDNGMEWRHTSSSKLAASMEPIALNTQDGCCNAPTEKLLEALNMSS